jgi:outer membrane biosynthesis protein TonB
MDKIFQEIKKAIEEEMRNAEGGPPPGGGRSQAGGGRRAQEYAEWLKEEQERLRGGRSQAPTQPEPLQEVQVEQPPEEEWVPQTRPPRRPQQQESQQRPQQERRQQRSDRSERESRQRRQDGQQARQRQTQQSRRERPQRPQRRERDAYRLRTASQMGSQIERLLRSPNGLRQAFLLREIVSKPVSLREPNDHLIS